MDNYEDIINLPHHISKKHFQMSIENRAAQFAPFAALTGFDDEVEESARLTDNRIELEDEFKIIISKKIKYLIENKDKNNEVIITYFVPDDMKIGGKYIDKRGNVRKVNSVENLIILEDKTEILISEIIDINGEVFNELY